MRKNLRLNSYVAVLGLTLLLSACSTSSAAREWLKAPGWSHGLPVAETRLGDPVPMALDEAGNVYLFLITAENAGLQPTVVALNRQAEIVWIRTLAISLTRPDKPAILWDGQALRLFWISAHTLYETRMDTSGSVIAPVRALSGGKIVDSYDVVLNADGLLTVWYAGQRRDPGLYALAGDLTSQAALVDPEGVRPTLQVDESGALHAAWAHYPPGFEDTILFYAVYPGGAFEMGRETAVYQPRLSITDILIGPLLGMDKQRAYLVWNISVRTGPEAGKILTEYVHFPHGQPAAMVGPERIIVPRVSDLAYTYEPEDGLAAGLRVFPVTGQYPGTPAVTDVALNGAAVPQQELALAFHARVRHEFRNIRGQIGTLFLQEGQPTGYQLLTFTPDASLDPAIVSDKTGWLYLTWLERGDEEGFQVYFASAAPDIQDALSGVTWGDAARIAREAVFGLLSGAVLTPFVALLWLLAPLLILYLTRFLRRRDEDKLTGIGTIFSLLLGGTVYWVAKLMTVPDMRSYVPFSAWIPAIPGWLQAPLQIGVPAAITIVAVAVAWRFTYRQQTTSLLYFALLFVAVDSLLTMAVYGFLIYNMI